MHTSSDSYTLMKSTSLTLNKISTVSMVKQSKYEG